MMKTMKAIICCLPFAAGVGSTAQAQGTYDMSKFTCEKLLQGTGNSVDAAIWFSGYYNGLRKNTKLNFDQFRNNAEAICRVQRSTQNDRHEHDFKNDVIQEVTSGGSQNGLGSSVERKTQLLPMLSK